MPAKRRRLSVGLALTVCAGLAGCGGVPIPAPPTRPALPPAYQSAAPGSEALAVVAGGAWWQVFGDPVLNELVARAERQNTSIEGAAARLAQARALLRGAEANATPQASFNAGVGRQGGPLVNAAGASGTLLTLGASVAYEPDFFGRWAQGRQAAQLDWQSRAAWLLAARLLVQADVAQAYLALRALDAEQVLAEQSLQAWRETLRLTEARWRAGAVPEQAVLRLRGELASNQAETAALARRRDEQLHALAVLLGEPASAFSLPQAAPGSSPPALPQVPAGLPSQMLSRRPDVAAAQHAEAAAWARSGQARRAWLPSLALTATGGHASAALAELLGSSTRAWGLSALLSLPLLDGGRRDAGIAHADAVAQAEAAAHGAAILGAFRDVEDQLSALGHLAEQARWHAQSAEVAQRAQALTASRLRQGLASTLEWLDAQRQALRSQRLLLQIQAAQAHSTVALIKALGGGWDSAPAS